MPIKTQSQQFNVSVNSDSLLDNLLTLKYRIDGVGGELPCSVVLEFKGSRIILGRVDHCVNCRYLSKILH